MLSSYSDESTFATVFFFFWGSIMFYRDLCIQIDLCLYSDESTFATDFYFIIVFFYWKCSVFQRFMYINRFMYIKPHMMFCLFTFRMIILVYANDFII